MNNELVFNRFNVTNVEYTSKLFWIAVSISNHELHEFIDGLDEDDWKNLFSDVHDPVYILNQDQDDDTRLDFLINNNKFGLIAEIKVPVYDENDMHTGLYEIHYTYTETLEELITKIENL